jgi:NAD(P)-dependent dehydrogenase (short-subunit alcohol dehydrogenase family)
MSASPLFKVEDLAVAVTGGASGIGYAIAEIMAQEGAHVVLCDVDGPSLANAVETMQARGFKVSGELCDIAVTGAIGAALDRVVARQGRLDVVFANAGVSAGPGFSLSADGCLDGSSRNAWGPSLAINLTGTFDTLAAAARHMKAARRGSIIVTSSISALAYSPVSAYAYIAAKAALNAVVRQAVSELGPYNVRINAIAPGFTRTNIAGGKLKNDADAAENLRRRVPLCRLGEADDIKGLALLLASEASSYITGTVTAIDGGVATL